eukprot:gene6279-2910_t
MASGSRADTQDVSAEDFTLLQMLIKDYSPAGAIASTLQMLLKDYSPAGGIASTLQAAYDEGRMTQFAPTVPSEDEEGLPVSSEVRAQAAVKAVAKMDDLVTAIVSILGGVEYPESRLTPKVSKQIQQQGVEYPESRLTPEVSKQIQQQGLEYPESMLTPKVSKQIQQQGMEYPESRLTPKVWKQIQLAE